MRILVLYAHPDPESFSAALHGAAVEALRRAGHEVDDCDLYAERFDPVLPLAERRAYLDVPANRAPVESHIHRLEHAEALVLVYPVWNFGLPAILKGYFDRVFLPGVSFRLVEGRATPNLSNIKTIVAVTSYGAPRWRAMLVGDPPRRFVTRALRLLVALGARTIYLAHHDMNRSTDRSRSEFLARVVRRLERLR